MAVTHTNMERVVLALAKDHDEKITVFSEVGIEGVVRRKVLYLRLLVSTSIGTKFVLVPVTEDDVRTMIEALQLARRASQSATTLAKVMQELKAKAKREQTELELHCLVHCPELESIFLRNFEVFYADPSIDEWRVLLRFTLKDTEMGRTLTEQFEFLRSGIQVITLIGHLEDMLKWLR